MGVPELILAAGVCSSFPDVTKTILASERSIRILGMLAATIKGISDGWEPKASYKVMDFFDAYRAYYSDDPVSHEDFWLHGLYQVSQLPFFDGRIQRWYGDLSKEYFSLQYCPEIVFSLLTYCHTNGVPTRFTVTEMQNSQQGKVRPLGHPDGTVV